MIFILEDESNILEELQALDRDVFFYLIKRVDYKTGIIGETCRVSYGGMAYDLSERDMPGRAKHVLRTLTSKQIENSIGRLIKANLLNRLSKSGKNQYLILVRKFFYDRVYRDSSAKKQVGRRLGGLIGDIESIFNNKINEKETNNIEGCVTGWEEVGTTSSFTYLPNKGPRGEELFPLTMDWQPSQPELTIFLERSGKFTMDDVKVDWINGFVLHWWKEGKRQDTQRGWTAKLAVKLMDYLKNPGIYEKLNGIKKPINNKVVNINSVRTPSLPDWARVPKDDEVLVKWMRLHKYGDPPIGYNNSQSRMWLQAQVERRLKEWKLERDKKQS